MSMSVNWTLNFPEVSYHAARVMVSDEDGAQTNPDWDPAEDLKQHLEKDVAGSLLTSEGVDTTRAGLEEWISPKV